MTARIVTPSWIGKSALALLVAFALLVSGFYDLGHFDHNDFQYGVTPVLMARGRLYQDFSFDQTPLEAWLGFVVLKLVGGRWLFLALRVISLLCVWAAAGIGIALVRKRAARRDLVTALLVAGWLTVPPLVVIAGEIGNYSLGLVLLAAALWVFLERPAWAWAVGLLAAAAVAAKLSNIYLLAAFGGLYLAGARRWRNLPWFGLGALIGAAPILYYLLRTPRAFLFENLTYHYLINLYRGVPFHVPLWPLGMVAVLVLAAAPLLRAETWATEAWAIMAVLVAAMIGTVSPGILFPQYWAPPDFLLVLLGCLLVARWPPRLAWLVLAVMLVLAGIRATAMLDEARAQAKGGNYGVAAVEALRARITAAVAAIPPECHGDLVSALAMTAVGSGVPIAPISSEGPFMMRLDPVLTGRADWFRGYSDVRRYLTPRSVLLLGYDPGTWYQAAMQRYAAAHGFRTVAVGRLLGKPVTLAVPGGCDISGL